jgi:4-methyl-5(b-hydroxyethyl)-thiazole monophosphate biosynthesis
MMAKKVLVVLAEGFEEIEAVTVVDVLRRAGHDVKLAGISCGPANGAHGIKIETDISIEKYNEIPDLLILPGGMPGAQNLAESPKVMELIQKTSTAKKLIGAICAAPAVTLVPAGVLNLKKATCFPGFERRFPPSVTFVKDRVVVDGNVVTSRGPGSALEFAIELVRQLGDNQKAETLREGMLVKG